MDSLPNFPRSAVHLDTEARLTLEFGKGSSEPRPCGRPRGLKWASFKKVATRFSHYLKTQQKV